jgi:hypothetical protein
VFRGINNRGQRKEPDPALPGGKLVSRCAPPNWNRAAGSRGCRSRHLRNGRRQAYLNGVPELSIMRQSRHQSLDTVRKYIRDRSLFLLWAAAPYAVGCLI